MRLNDEHMNAIQFMLKSQFSYIKGLSSTVCSLCYSCWITQYLQILHFKGNHGIAVSSLKCAKGEIKVYDSNYCSVSEDIKTTLHTIFGTIMLP